MPRFAIVYLFLLETQGPKAIGGCELHEQVTGLNSKWSKWKIKETTLSTLGVTNSQITIKTQDKFQSKDLDCRMHLITTMVLLLVYVKHKLNHSVVFGCFIPDFSILFLIKI